MKLLYPNKAWLLCLFCLHQLSSPAQKPTIITPGSCDAVVANFNTDDNGFNSPSIYGSIFDSSFYYHGGRGYWTDYLPPLRVDPPGFPRVLNIISPPYQNPNPSGTFNVGFYYICNNPAVDRFQVRIISVTETPIGTITNVEATSGLQFMNLWNTPVPYIDNGPDPTPFLNGFEGYVCIKLIDPDIINAPNTRFRVEISYIIHEPFFAVVDNLSIGAQTIPLPVNFIGLVGERNDNAVNLRWDVSEEVNVMEYQVERSENGSSFSPVGTIAAKGKSIYSFSNFNAPSKNLYYRVKSVDIDGRFKYSGIIRLAAGTGNTYSERLVAYPTPSRDQVTITHHKIQRGALISISSMDGRILKTITPATGSSHTFINMAGMLPGVYLLRLDDGLGNTKTIKLVRTE